MDSAILIACLVNTGLLFIWGGRLHERVDALTVRIAQLERDVRAWTLDERRPARDS